MSRGDDRKAWEEFYHGQQRAPPLAVPTAPRQKYGATRTEVHGIVFQSAKESRRYLELTILQAAKDISNLELQPKFALTVTPLAGGEPVKVAEYWGDFSYLKNGQRIIEDAKSPATQKNRLYRLKKKFVEALYGVTIQEV